MKFAHFVLLMMAVSLLGSCQKKESTEQTVERLEKNIGLQMYSLREDIGQNAENVEAMIAEIGKVGYKYVETANYNEGLIYNYTPAEFKAKLEENGLWALSCHVNHEIWKDEKDKLAVIEWWDACIAAHKEAGMKYVIVPWMATPGTLDSLKLYCDYYNEIGAMCKAQGMKFGYHNHAFEFEKVYNDSIVMYNYLVENTDPEKVIFELDVYWSHVGGVEAPALFEKYPGRFEVLHIKDEKELGASGTIDFENIFNNIGRSGAKYLIVEVEKYDFPPVESIKKSLDFLNDAPFVKACYEHKH